MKYFLVTTKEGNIEVKGNSVFVDDASNNLIIFNGSETTAIFSADVWLHVREISPPMKDPKPEVKA